MSRFSVAALCVLVIAGVTTTGARAQAQSAEAHVAAAKAAATGNPKPGHSYDARFRLICSEPRPNARPQPVGPGESDELAKTVATPRDKWYVPPAKVFDNL